MPKPKTMPTGRCVVWKAFSFRGRLGDGADGRVVGGEERSERLDRRASVCARLQSHQDLVGRTGGPLRKEAQEGLVGHDEVAVRREAAADREGRDHGERAVLRLEAERLARVDRREDGLRHVPDAPVDQGHVGVREVGEAGVDLGVAEASRLRVDAEDVEPANRAVRLFPVNLAEIDRCRAGNARRGQRLEHALAGHRAAVGQAVHVGGGDEDVGVEGGVGQSDARDEGAEEAELHEDQDVGEGDAGERGGEARAIVDELEPADRQPAEQPFQDRRHGSDPTRMRAVTCRLVKRRARAADSGASAT